MGAEAEMDERRRSPRYEVTKTVKGRVKPSMDVRVVNISEHGLMIEAPFGLPPAGTCELTLLLRDGEMLIRARVARCRADMVKQPGGQPLVRFRAGLEFFDDFAESAEVKHLIASVCSEGGHADLHGSVTLREALEQAM
jgi:hypothetical protein